MSVQGKDFLKGVIFDMDGVLVDSEPIHALVEKEIFRKIGIDIPDSLHHNFIGLPTKSFCQYMKDTYNLTHTVDELLEMKRKDYWIYLENKKDLSPIAGVKDLIEELYEQNVKLLLASSSGTNDIQKILELLDLTSYFSVIASADEVTHGKPFPDVYLLALEKGKLNKNQCIVIEDSTNGIQAAKSAGLRCIAFKNAGSDHQNVSGADFVITDFKELNTQRLRNYLDRHVSF